jgi:DNA polymerase-3 subunit delta'
MARAALAMDDEPLRYDRLEGWPAPEEQPAWLGDPAAETALLDAYRSGRMHHAWLIGGPKGIGKATLAYRFARFVLAHPDPGAAGVAAATNLAVPETHPAFRKVATRAHPNLLVLERPWDSERKRFRTVVAVEEIRKTVGFFGSTGGEDNWRIAIVDPADDMNASSANALLKILEEPPARSLFLIVSHAPGRSLPTIRSRCRRLELAPLSDEAIAAALAEHDVAAADVALAAALSDGSLRQAALIGAGEGIAIYRDLARLLATLPRLDVAAAHALADRVAGRGNDDAWTAFAELLGGWLNRRVRGAPEPDGGTQPGPGVTAAPLATWAELWDKFRTSVAQADELNLDRKRTVLSIIMAFARATRM